MATTHEIPASRRTDTGKGASRRLRRTGTVPGIVYGGHADPLMVELEHKLVMLVSKSEWFYSNILDLSVDGDIQRVVLRDMQRHPFKPQIMHLDFQRVTETETLRVRIPLHFLNEEKSPAGKTSGVVVSHMITEIEISALPKDLPEYIEVDLGKLQIGEIIHVSDLKLPAGVEIPELKLGKEHDHAVVTAQHVAEQKDDEVAPEGDAV